MDEQEKKVKKRENIISFLRRVFFVFFVECRELFFHVVDYSFVFSYTFFASFFTWTSASRQLPENITISYSESIFAFFVNLHLRSICRSHFMKTGFPRGMISPSNPSSRGSKLPSEKNPEIKSACRDFAIKVTSLSPPPR